MHMATGFRLVVVECGIVVVLIHDFLRRPPGNGGLVLGCGEPALVIVLHPDFALCIGYIEFDGIVLVLVVNIDFHVASSFLALEQKGGGHKESRCIRTTHRQTEP